MFKNRFARDASMTVADAVSAAEARGDAYVGTEHLLLGLLRATGNEAAQAFHAGGLDRARALELLVAMDESAMAAFGVEMPAGTLALLPSKVRHRRFTAGAKSVLEGAVLHGMRCRAKGIHNAHLALALLDAERPDVVAQLLDRAGVDVGEVQRRLAAAA